jgi:hypothetical protein
MVQQVPVEFLPILKNWLRLNRPSQWDFGIAVMRYCADQEILVSKLACQALLLAASHRNTIFASIVVPGPNGISFFAGAATLSLPKVRSDLRMLSRMRAQPKINWL